MDSFKKMEPKDGPKLDNIYDMSKNVIQTKEYICQIKADTYALRITSYSNQTIHFYLKQTNKISLYCYEKILAYDQIINTLKLPKERKDIKTVFMLYDMAITKDKVILQEDSKKKSMILNMQKEIDFLLVQCIKMNQKPLKYEDIIRIMAEEINKLKNIQTINDTNQNKKNEEKKNIIEEKLKLIENEREKEREEIKQMKINLEYYRKELKSQIKDLKNEMRKKIEELKNGQKRIIEEQKKIEKDKNKQEELLKNKMDIQFKKDPSNLKYIENITNNNSCDGYLCNFVLFNGIKDNIDYIVYNNKINYNIDIMRINDKTIIKSLRGHKIKTTVIKYYINDNKEEYILSCDYKLVILWDIQKNYNKKYNLKEGYNGNIHDALLLFNIFNKNYILISSNNNNEYSKLYGLRDNTPFIRNIYGTKENITKFMIPWLYNNKYYIIECCNKKISINNMLEDECYANLNMNPEGNYLCGYIYNDNYLCVSDYNNNCIKIWDLVKKVKYNEIKYDSNFGYEIIPWNNKYAIVGSSGGFAIINIEEGKMVKKIKIGNTYVYGVKKMKLNKLGECLIIADSNYNIKLYSI